MKKKSDLSIVVAAYGALDYTKLLVESIRKHSKYDHEIVIYSDGSPDGTVDWLRTLDGIIWDHDPENRGICTATNRAAKLATRDNLFFPNTDHVVSAGWDEALLSKLDPNTVVSAQTIEPGIVPVSPLYYERNCGTDSSSFDEPAFLAAASDLAQPKAVPGVNYPFALARSLWEKVGGLDPRFDPGPANDPDFFYRLHFAGARMIRALDCILYHFSGKSSRMAGEAQSETRRWHEITVRNEARFVEKWGEKYRYANGGLPDPGPEANKRAAPGITVTTPLRVLYDARSIEPGAQGIGTYTRELLLAMLNLKDGPVFDCVTRNPELLPKNQRVRFVGRELDQESTDVVHGTSFELPSRKQAPSIATIHDLAFRLFPEWYPEQFVRHMDCVVGNAVRDADVLIAVSQSTRRDLIAELSADPSKIECIHEGVSERECGDPMEAKSRYTGGRNFILSVGVQQKRKNAPGLVRAYVRLLEELDSPPMLLLVGGEACEDPDLKTEIERFSLGDHVILTPHVPEPDLEALYRSATFLAYPSLYEGFGLPLLEAMRSGTPVVTSDRGALPEIAGDAARIVDPESPEAVAESMKEVLEDSSLRDELVAKGKRRSAEFTWERTAMETVSVYQRAIESKPVRVQGPRKNRPRVSVDARLFGMNRLGTGRYTTEILRALLRGHPEVEFVFVGPERLDPALLPDKTEVMRHVPAGTATLLDPAWEQFTMPTHLMGCDVHFSPTGILPLARPVPGVVVVHDIGFEDHPEHFDKSLQRYLSKWIKASCHSADRVISVSEFTRKRLESVFGLEGFRVSVVHHGKPRHQIEKTECRRTLLCVSAFEPNKNLSFLLDVFSQIAPRWEGELVIAGRRGRDFDRMERGVEDAGLAKLVRLVPDPTDEKLHGLYGSAELFLFPSLYEGFGLPLLEAMSAGLPVVTGSAASCPEVVGDAGVVLESMDPEAWSKAILDVLSNSNQRNELSEKSLHRAHEFSWERAADETWNALMEAI